MRAWLPTLGVLCIFAAMFAFAGLLAWLVLRERVAEGRRRSAWEPLRARLGARWGESWGRPALYFETRGLRGVAEVTSARGAGLFTRVEVAWAEAPPASGPTESLGAVRGWKVRREAHRAWASRSGVVLDVEELSRIVTELAARAPAGALSAGA